MHILQALGAGLKIFISWSGERSELLAKALRDWFPLVLHYVEPWLSQSDIQAGERWGVEVAKELESCNFGVICVTKDNLTSPWMLFEAGALAKSMQDGRVIPLLLDLDFKEISGPLSQFQAKKADATGIRELAASLNKAAQTPVPDGQFEKLFTALWTDLEKNVASLPKSPTPSKHSRPQGEILEELVSSVRTVEMRMRDVIDEEAFPRRRRKPRYHPRMVQELMHRVSEGPQDPIRILVAGSFLKEDFPWIYELAVDANRAIKSGPQREAEKAFRRFFEALDMVLNSPLSEEFSGDRSLLAMLHHDLIQMLDYTRFTPNMATKANIMRRGKTEPTTKKEE
jgi:hypothetical protein